MFKSPASIRSVLPTRCLSVVNPDTVDASKFEAGGEEPRACEADSKGKGSSDNVESIPEG